MGLLTDLIVLGNFLLKGRTRRWKSISKVSPDKGAKPGGPGTSFKGVRRHSWSPKQGSL